MSTPTAPITPDELLSPVDLHGIGVTLAIHAQDMRGRGIAEQASGDELLKLADQLRSPYKLATTTPAPVLVAAPIEQWTEGIISVTPLSKPSRGAIPQTYSPTSWRLARRNGELILQAGSIWQQGRESGFEWNDVPTVDLDELDGTPEAQP